MSRVGQAAEPLPTCADELHACYTVMHLMEEQIDLQEKQLRDYATKLKQQEQDKPLLTTTEAILLGIIVGGVTVGVVK